jgi:hypothetical protein
MVSLRLPFPFHLPPSSRRSFDSYPRPYARACFLDEMARSARARAPSPHAHLRQNPPPPQKHAPLAHSRPAPASRCRVPAADEARPMVRRLCPGVLPCRYSQRPPPSAMCAPHYTTRRSPPAAPIPSALPASFPSDSSYRSIVIPIELVVALASPSLSRP